MKNKIIISSILTIAMCFSLIAGSTFALFTSNSEVNVTISSAKVDIDVEASGLVYKSTLGETLLGSANLDGNVITLENLVPGDYVTFTLTVTNNSTVAVNYRALINVVENKGLLDGLVISYNEAFASSWDVLAASTEEDGTTVKTVTVRIELPEDAGNEYQGKSCKLAYVVEAVQGNVSVIDDISGLKDAIENGEKTITLKAGEYTLPESLLKADTTLICSEGTVFTGTSSLNVNGATIVGGTFENEGGMAVSGTINGTFKNCTFDGNETLRWCYTKAGETVVFENCTINTTLRGIHFDEMNGDVIFRNCYINGFNAYSGTGTITFENCVFGYSDSNYNGLNIYSNTNLINCRFEYVSGKTNFIDMEGTGKTLTITNCTATLDGAAVSVSDFVGGSKLSENTVVYN